MRFINDKQTEDTKCATTQKEKLSIRSMWSILFTSQKVDNPASYSMVYNNLKDKMNLNKKYDALLVQFALAGEVQHQTNKVWDKARKKHKEKVYNKRNTLESCTEKWNFLQKVALSLFQLINCPLKPTTVHMQEKVVNEHHVSNLDCTKDISKELFWNSIDNFTSTRK